MTVMLITFGKQATRTANGGTSIQKFTSLLYHFPACCHAMVEASTRESIALSLFALEAGLQCKQCINSCGCVSAELGAGELANSSKLLEAGLRHSV
jgi:hypothetical protein